MQQTSEIFSTLEEKFGISKRPCKITNNTLHIPWATLRPLYFIFLCTFDVVVLKKSAPQNATVMVCVLKGPVKLVNVILAGCPVTAVYQHVLFHVMMAHVM